MQKSKINSLLWIWLPTILWIVLIAIESTKYLSGANTGSWLKALFGQLHAPISEGGLEQLNFLARKTGHFCGYGILSGLFFHSWRRTRWLYPRYRKFQVYWRPTWMFFALLGTLIVASLDEWHQSFLASRTGTPKDVALDMVGGLVFQCLILTLFAIHNGGFRFESRSISASEPR